MDLVTHLRLSLTVPMFSSFIFYIKYHI